jgi:pSer/pThr/pTyr-binding forkhead associated (FHA) protein
VWLLRTDEDAQQPFLFRILPGNMKTLGRAPRADFIVDAALVSRLHCRLTAGAGEIEAIDLKSTNGTYVNGSRVERGLLRHGDRLRVGSVELVVVKDAASQKVNSQGPTSSSQS